MPFEKPRPSCRAARPLTTGRWLPPNSTSTRCTTRTASLGNLLDVLASAAPEDKAEVYRRLGLQLTYDPARRVVIAESDPWAKVSVGEPISPKRPPGTAVDPVGESKCRRGDLNPHALAGTSPSS